MRAIVSNATSGLGDWATSAAGQWLGIGRRLTASLATFAPAHEKWDSVSTARARAVRGRVVLVGAGPGDVELLTIKALRAIESADVILHDALVSPQIMAVARRDAVLISVGKRGGRTSCKQTAINDLMVAYAKAGKAVVRLKSGDPSIFGRSGEEISFLRSEGIEVGVVPGVTTATAMAAALGVSLTHRDCAKSVRFVTGHSKHGALPEDVDWQAIADTSATTIFYMGAQNVNALVSRLLDLGMPSTTPCAVAASVGHPDEEYRRCTLTTLQPAVRSLAKGAPIIFGIGQVFAATEQLEGMISAAHPLAAASPR